MDRTVTQYERVFDVFKAFPDGLASFELDTLVDEISPRPKTSSLISLLVTHGLAFKDGAKVNPATGSSVCIYKPTGRLFSQRLHEVRAPRRKRRGPFESEVKELREWKAKAIARFPELGLDPAILKARAHVSKILRDEGNEAKAVMVEMGELDSGEMMRAVIALLR